MNLKKDWKTIYQTDQDWLRVRKDGSEPTLEHVDEVGEYEDEEGFTQKKFLLYQLEPLRLKVARDPKRPDVGYLVPEGYDESWSHPVKDYEEWFASDLEEVARFTGSTVKELVAGFTSADPTKRARAYEEVASYHGYANFDTEPREINEPELDERWS